MVKLNEHVISAINFSWKINNIGGQFDIIFIIKESQEAYRMESRCRLKMKVGMKHQTLYYY